MVYRRTKGLEVMLLINDAGAKVTVERCENVKQYCEVGIAYPFFAPHITKWPKAVPNLNSKGTRYAVQRQEEHLKELEMMSAQPLPDKSRTLAVNKIVRGVRQ